MQQHTDLGAGAPGPTAPACPQRVCCKHVLPCKVSLTRAPPANALAGSSRWAGWWSRDQQHGRMPACLWDGGSVKQPTATRKLQRTAQGSRRPALGAEGGDSSTRHTPGCPAPPPSRSGRCVRLRDACNCIYLTPPLPIHPIRRRPAPLGAPALSSRQRRSALSSVWPRTLVRSRLHDHCYSFPAPGAQQRAARRSGPRARWAGASCTAPLHAPRPPPN
jgi:hypothetical protein